MRLRRTTIWRRGFTMVELLVVIAIIGILVALLVPAVWAAVIHAKNAVIATEISNLAKALERYKMEYGEYPPDFSSGDPNQIKTEIDLHLSRIFRNRVVAQDPVFEISSVEYAKLDPTTALYFWLRGFSPDPLRPISGLGERNPLFDFDPARLTVVSDYARAYYPKGASTTAPFIYYRSKNNYKQALIWSKTKQVAAPYLSEVTAAQVQVQLGQMNFAEPDKFQIICAGLDGEYGVGGINYPSGVGPGNMTYSAADRDNLTNFSEGKTLESAMP